MKDKHQKHKELVTSRGTVIVSSFCGPSEMLSFSFRETFISEAKYHSIISKKETLVKAALKPDANVTLAYTTDNEVVGFAILEYPSIEGRWSKVGNNVMMEVSVIEVSRPWRNLGIAKELLRLVVDHPLKDDRILYMVGYSWTWDLVGTDLSSDKYHDVMIRLFSAESFKPLWTNEINIRLRPENLFMARIGKNITKDLKSRFSLVQYNVNPDQS
ncbi:GNAT family N-acetyltransferase [bacterium]|nr:GNAT family N-acetyltransferase [bacterium]